ncbi:hypothetical protein AFLA_003445 [Aspergillus flavus NRRL3357]|nr:hypothetical protein AFLA_003445 [Aspergillus flavus NRRL3357]
MLDYPIVALSGLANRYPARTRPSTYCPTFALLASSRSFQRRSPCETLPLEHSKDSVKLISVRLDLTDNDTWKPAPRIDPWMSPEPCRGLCLRRHGQMSLKR